jgi:FMN phosphatase YigB (HAD superfamily)
MSKAILFDLDGTLLQVDTDKFVEHYMKALVPHIIDFMPADKFLKVLWDSTNVMIRNIDENLTNEEVFTQHFLESTGINKEEIWPVFDRFYLEHFPKLKVHTSPSKDAKEIIQIAKEQGRKIAIATNPVFPKAAIYERLNWLGLGDYPFDLVTVYEESHFCKPQTDYFMEVLNKMDVAPENAIMIGNDMQEDMVASQLGMETYLVTDYLIDRGTPQYKINQKGTLEELKKQIKAKQGVFSN